MNYFDDTPEPDTNDQQEDVETSRAELNKRAPRIRALLKTKLGDDVFSSWFGSLEFESYDDTSVQVSVPVKFLRNWIQSHYVDELLACCRKEFAGIERVDIQLRTPSPVHTRTAASAAARPAEPAPSPVPASAIRRNGALSDASPSSPPVQRNSAGGLEGSPLDPRYTFETFIVGASNRMAHAAAVQAAETVLAAERGFNPLFIHAGVGLGKSHLLHAIAWEVKRRTPNAQVLYLTAERFLFQFVEAIHAQEAIAFKNKFRTIDILLDR